jgi:DNA-3-methyladenine glycosylase I
MENHLKRCWNTSDPLYIKYHDEEWGVPLHDDERLFEFLVLDAFQTGLSWWLILQRRDCLREAFDGFNPRKIANYADKDVERIMNAPQMIKNRLKIRSTITNAQEFLCIQEEFGSFDSFIWKFVQGKPVNNHFSELSKLPSETEESGMMSRELKRRGFRFVGPTICYSFMQAAGMVNDHLVDCFRNAEIRKMQ